MSARAPGPPGAVPTPDERAQIEAIFEEALDVPAGRRAAWLATRCEANAALRGEVELLLAAHEQEGVLDVPLSIARRDPSTGRRIGPYRVLRELGRGGMGVVYLAERDDGHYRQRVAVKVLRASADTEEMHRRFLAERQILASLSHPNVAQLLDGGVSDGQLPYLVIEYVDGLPITEYCDRHRLGVEARLKLFMAVCAAVNHAHQNLVLHRDLKPSNVLVTSAGDVKLLDFGIAKLLNPSLSGQEQPVTHTAFRLMTPAYASPEQVRGDTLTTASDVYTLGLLLYELLSGRLAHRITTDSPREVFEVVCEREPDRLSTSIASEEAAAARDTTTEKLARRLRGDLDAIVANALRKEPGRRYGSAELLAEDVGRYLDGLPVTAQRGNRWYRVEKMIRRHQAAALFAAASVVLLLVGAGVALRLASVAARERDRAAAALIQSQSALGESEAVTAFLVSLFEASDPAEGRLDTLNASDLLRRGVARAERLGDAPLAQARMFEGLGRVHAMRDDLTRATDLLQRALTLRRTHLGPAHPATAASASELANMYRRQGRYTAADTLAREALLVRRAALGENHPDVAASLGQVAGLAIYLGQVAEAERYALEAVNVRRRTGTDSGMVADLERLAAIYWRRGDSDRAERSLREALEIGRRLFPSPHPGRSGTLLRLADLVDERPDRRVEAESLYFAALAESRAAVGNEHPGTASTMSQTGLMLARHGRLAEGERLIRQAFDIERRTWGPTHTAVAGTMTALALVLTVNGYNAEAERLDREAAAIYGAAWGTNHAAYGGAIGYLADMLALRGALDSAETLHRLAVSIRSTAVGPEETLTALSVIQLANVVAKQRRFAEADSLLRWSLGRLRTRTTDTHKDVRRAFNALARLFDLRGKPDSAAHYRRLAGPDDLHLR
ncbi:MAG TPA: tetratricopeptide repeat protein [Gemmatimonadaceae bacterium]|nr:tetratricopeptide repeat protein [Gemmatimonadaceae bacterium]